MKKSILSAAFIILLAVIFAGCSKTDNNPTETNTGNFLNVTPTDSATNVSPNQSIILQFATTVDPSIIEKNFMIMSDSAAGHAFGMMMNPAMRYSQMQQAMSNTTMMNQLRSNYSTKGSFTWNSDNTRCVFKPDSSLLPNMEYMMLIDNDMTNYMRSVMSGHNMMGGGMNMMNNYSMNSPNIMLLFWTGGN